MENQHSEMQNDNAPYLLYYVNSIIQNEIIMKEQNEYIEKLKKKLTLMKSLKDSDVYDLLDANGSIEGLIDKNSETIKSLEKEILDINTKVNMPTRDNV